MVLSGLDFGGPLPRQGQAGSGDMLVRTIRQVAAALSVMASAKHAAVSPACEFCRKPAIGVSRLSA